MQDLSDAVTNIDHQGRKTRGFKDLIAWQRAMQLVLAVYKLTAQFPLEERYGLSGQMRRAVVSIPSNVAEGYGRCSSGEYRQAVGYARGSSAELETQLMIAKRLHYAPDESIDHAERLCEEVSKLVNALMHSLKA